MPRRLVLDVAMLMNVSKESRPGAQCAGAGVICATACIAILGVDVHDASSSAWRPVGAWEIVSSPRSTATVPIRPPTSLPLRVTIGGNTPRIENLDR